ncbi:orotidine-5'-phosphate decarboxylase [Geoglobus acetivorans]|uniref:Orotidine 5'-phosphate decarboxylase n=1 Tax=Geoglobus acetivorans TaxID=565033 RepID=A0A0A7GFZ7_GEOAI|nr:Orotidine 5'-phosphate decarboxylase [Geoglobus acetivorans]
MLILALDVQDKEVALDIARKCGEYVDFIKVNYPLVLSAGIDVVSGLSRIRPVIADFKIADIPYTASLIADIAFRHGVRAVIAHGFAGRDMLQAVRDVADRYGGEVYAVTELSSQGGREFMTGHALEIVDVAKEVGCDGLIAPATRPERIAEIKRRAGSLKVICPGVGAQGGTLEDVLKAGADGIIVGRTIYQSEDPARTAREIRERIDGLMK